MSKPKNDGPTLNEAKNARERLKPLRKMLDDIDVAVDYALAHERETDSRKTQNAGLRQEMEGLQKERNALEAEVKQTAEAHAVRMKEEQAAFQRERDEHKKTLAGLQEAIAKHTKQAAEQQTQLEAEHKARTAEYRATIKDLEEQIGKLTGVIETMRRQVQPLLR